MPDAQLNPYATWFWPALLGLWLAASIVCRRHLGQPLWASTLASASFSERWASARMGTGLMARLGTARHCIHVQVADGLLEIHPHFPFTLGFMAEIYDLDHQIPLENIRSAVILSEGRAKAVEVKYTTAEGDEGMAQLLLRQAEAFVRTVVAKPPAA